MNESSLSAEQQKEKKRQRQAERSLTMWGDEFLRYLVLGVFRILLHVFFNDVEVVGRLNVPKKGPVIFVGALTHTPLRARLLSSED